MDKSFRSQDTASLLSTLNDPLFSAKNIHVQVLRTDLLHPVISGNKWMKLQPWLRAAKHTGVKGIVTKGGPWSNHVHATAYACSKENLQFTAVIKAKEGMMTPMTDDIIQWGASIIYCQHELYKNETHWENFSIQKNHLYIPTGGEGAKGIEGVTHFFDQLGLPAYDYIICPVGTGTTMMGIADSVLQYSTLVGINPGIEDENYKSILEILSKRHEGKSFQILKDIDLKKFGQWPPHLIQGMNEWYKKWQLPSDIVYTAKMFYKFEQLVTANFFDPGSHILLIHTGGLQGNRSLPAGSLIY